jgi:membrane protein
VDFDMIFGYYDPDSSRSFKEIVKERMLSMLFVVAIAVLFLLSLFVSNIVKYVAGTDMNDTVLGQVLSNLLSFLINLMMFSALYYFAPSKTPKIKTAVEAAIFTSVAFVFGKILIGLYF